MTKLDSQLPERSAALAGASLVLLVGCSQGAFWLQSTLLAMQQKAESEVLGNWFLDVVWLLLTVIRLLIPLLFLQFAGQQILSQQRKHKSAVPLWVLLPLFMGLVVLCNSMISLVRGLFEKITGLPASEMLALPKDGWQLLLYFLTICVAVPVLEELFFRGSLQPVLRVWGGRFALLITSLIFTLTHRNPWDLPIVLILSLLLGYTFEVTQSVGYCIVLHILNNLAAFFTQLARERMEPTAAIALILWVMLLLVATFVGAVWAVRHFKLGRRMMLRRDARVLGSFRERFKAIVKNPLFDFGVLVIVFQFILVQFKRS